MSIEDRFRVSPNDVQLVEVVSYSYRDLDGTTHVGDARDFALDGDKTLGSNDAWILTIWGVVAAIVILGSLLGAAVKACNADPLDVAFEKHVEEQTKKLCRYEWRIGRSSFWPERVLVCEKGRG